MSSDKKLWTNEEEATFISFLAEKTENAKPPLCFTDLCEEFKQMTKSSRTEKSLATRINVIRPNIHKLESINIDTKVKMLFALSGPVDESFLNELKEQADVKVDRYNRIVKYKKKGGGLQLSGAHSLRDSLYFQSSKERDQKMLELLAEKSQNATKPMRALVFVLEFKELTGILNSNSILKRRYRIVRDNIHKCTEYDTATKIRMMFVSGARVDESFLEELRKDAIVEVDNEQRITIYKANDGSLELQGEQSRSSRIRSAFAEKKRRRSEICIEPEDDDEDDSSNQKIVTRTINGKSQPILTHHQNRSETWQVVNFLVENVMKAKSVLGINQLSRDFIAKINSLQTSRALDAVRNRIHRLRFKIHELDNIDNETKVRMLFGLSAPVNQDYLKELQKYACVEVDDKKRITKYSANDGSLELEGNHNSRGKSKVNWVNRRQRSLKCFTLPSDSEEEEGDDNDDDEDDKEEEDDVEMESEEENEDKKEEEVVVEQEEKVEDNKKNNDVEIKLVKTRSGRVSKNCLNETDYHYDLPIGKIASQTDKRKITFYLGTATQKPTPSKKSRITESESSREVVYDGPGEPIPAELPVKREPIEYEEYMENWHEEEHKPNPSELLNMVQNTKRSPFDDVEYGDPRSMVDDKLNKDVKKELEESESNIHSVSFFKSSSLPNVYVEQSNRNESSTSTNEKEQTEAQENGICEDTGESISDLLPVKLEPMEQSCHEKENKPEQSELLSMEQYFGANRIEGFGNSPLIENNQINETVKVEQDSTFDT